MTHPEVAARVAQARRVADGFAAAGYATGMAEDLAAGFYDDGLNLMPSQVAAEVVTMHYGGYAMANGPARLGDVRFTQEMVGAFDPNVADSSGAAHALYCFADYARTHVDLRVLVHEMMLLPRGREAAAPGSDLERGLQDLTNLAGTPWLDPVLNVPVYATSFDSTVPELKPPRPVGPGALPRDSDSMAWRLGYSLGSHPVKSIVGGVVLCVVLFIACARLISAFLNWLVFGF